MSHAVDVVTETGTMSTAVWDGLWEVPAGLRFPACTRCGSQRRAVVDAGMELRGRCLDCGADVGHPC